MAYPESLSIHMDDIYLCVWNLGRICTIRMALVYEHDYNKGMLYIFYMNRHKGLHACLGFLVSFRARKAWSRRPRKTSYDSKRWQ